MSLAVILSVILGYFAILIAISFLTSSDSSNASFFTGKKESPWYVVAFGMIGASLSGVTFISVPGWVASSGFSYMQMVLGYLAGYLVIGLVLLPLYYRLNLTSIYTYLEERFGFWAYKTGAFFFLVSRVIGASFRLYLVAIVLQIAVFDQIGWPFWSAVLSTIVLIWVYTFRSGIKTIIWTDTLQTAAMLIAVVVSIFMIKEAFGWNFGQLVSTIADSDYSDTFFFDDWNDSKHFGKQFIGGAFIAIAMTGLDQDMMQKNLSCRSLKDAQKNMFWFSLILVFVNLLFLSLGALLYEYHAFLGLPAIEKADELYPLLALEGHLGLVAGVLFLVGLVAAAYSSADSALTALTTSFCVDFLGLKSDGGKAEERTRQLVHVGFSVLLFAVIVIFKNLNNQSVIAELFKVATYTYGPLLGMFAFGIITKMKVYDRAIPFIGVAAPIISYVLTLYSAEWFGGWQIGFELLPINGAITALFMLIFAKPKAYNA